LKNEVGNGTEFRTLSTMYYDKHLLIGQAYGNYDYINYSYDNLDRLTEIKYNDNENKKKTYIYGTDGNVSSVLDTASNTRTKYVYDLSGRLVETKEYSGTNLSGNQIVSNTEYFYQDRTNYLTWMNHNSPLGNLAVAFDYGILANGQMPDQVYNVWWNYTTHLSRSFDGLGRLSSSVINNVLTTSYSYKDVSDTQTTTQLQSMVTPAGTFTYTYDSLGNITSIFDGVNTISYEYDSLNQLVRENDQKNNVTYTYEYLNGNILSKKQYAYTTGALGEVVNTINYGYGDNVWKDLLTSYNGMNITYDNIGNMTSFNGKTYSWLGRQLQSISGLATYTYNMDGQRIGKKTSNADITYYYNGDILAGEKNGNTVTSFMYDENGDYIGFNYAGMNFYYIKNAQNDVIAIADSSGTVVTRYTYDSWGKLISVTGNALLGTLNPIRYRSYYYDNESGMYYLQSRYYNPEIGRFICADEVDVVSVSPDSANYDKNLFAYCDNNPVVRADSSGYIWHIVGGAAFGSLFAGIMTIGSNLLSGESVTKGLATSMVAGAASGALAASGIGIVGMVAGNTAISMVENGVNQIIENNGFDNFDVKDMVKDGVVGGTFAAIGGKGSGSKHLTNLGKQSVKRTFNAVTNKGLKAGLKEAGRAFVSYQKNTVKYYDDFGKGLIKDFLTSVSQTFLSKLL
ncbi:MAG: RHS repeat-associated core domain-containing protein, partial [Clostridia bacterium]|nr:RHS repeat-associated core domain-containing protein [Clostridia bacterium]